MVRRMWLRLAIAAIGLVLAVAGCGEGSGSLLRRFRPPLVVAPLSDTPAGTLRLLEWCWDHRDTVLYRGLWS